MLTALLKNLLRPRASRQGTRAAPDGPLRLHIGGQERHPDWRIVNIMPGESVDYVRSCSDLSPFGSETVLEIYASHVLEHLGYQRDLGAALKEFHRVLVPGGTLRVSVPDLTTLCGLFLDPLLDYETRFLVMRLIFGGQMDPADFHYVGLSEEFMTRLLGDAGFTGIQRVAAFGLFNDGSRLEVRGRQISLNVVARKKNDPDEPPPGGISPPSRPR